MSNEFNPTHRYVKVDTNVVSFKVGQELVRLSDSRYEGAGYYENNLGQHQYVADDCVEAI
jgi:hypothetical protein